MAAPSFEEFYRVVKAKAPDLTDEDIRGGYQLRFGGSGLSGSLARGVQQFGSSVRTGIESLAGDPTRAGQAAVSRSQDLAARYPNEVGLEPLKQAYAEGGVLGAGGELLSQIPKALAQQAPNLAATLTGARLGAMGGGAIGGPPGAMIGGIAGAAVPSLLTQFGTNVERQAAEGRTVDTGRAALGAIPQAALDVGASGVVLGRNLVGKVLGPGVKEALAKGAARSAERLATEKLPALLARGIGMGALAEVPTEVTQQMIERAQAGLPLTSPDALSEYGETAYQTSLLAPLGVLGRVGDRSQAKGIVAQNEAQAAQRANQEQAAQAADLEALNAQGDLSGRDRYVAEMQAREAALTAKANDRAAVESSAFV